MYQKNIIPKYLSDKVTINDEWVLDNVNKVLKVKSYVDVLGSFIGVHGEPYKNKKRTVYAGIAETWCEKFGCLRYEYNKSTHVVTFYKT